jgi:hypothetical protein
MQNSNQLNQMTRTLQKLLWFRTSDIFITKNKDSKQNLTTYITRNVQQEKLEKQKKITVAKFLVWEKKDIVGAKTFETRGELNLNLHVLARRSRDKKQQQLQMHERERERERGEREQKRRKDWWKRTQQTRGGRTLHETNALQNTRPLHHNIYARYLYVLPKACSIYIV